MDVKHHIKQIIYLFWLVVKNVSYDCICTLGGNPECNSLNKTMFPIAQNDIFNISVINIVIFAIYYQTVWTIENTLGDQKRCFDTYQYVPNQSTDPV